MGLFRWIMTQSDSWRQAASAAPEAGLGQYVCFGMWYEREHVRMSLQELGILEGSKFWFAG